MNNVFQKSISKSNDRLSIQTLIMLIVYVLVFLTYSVPDKFRLFTGPLLAMFMCLAILTEYYYIVPIICLVGNSSLYTIIGDHFQVLYLGIVLICARLILLREKNYKMSIKYFAVFMGVAATMVHLLIFDLSWRLRGIIYTLFWLFSIILVFNDFRIKKKDTYPIIFHTGMAIFISALQFTVLMLLGKQGGVLYVEDMTTGLNRYGVLGAGAGDPNCSGMYLLIGLFIFLFYCKKMKLYIKIPIVLCFLTAVFYTASVTTFVFLLLIICLYVLLLANSTKKIKIMCGLFTLAMLAFVIMNYFEIDVSQNETMARFIEKLTAAESGDLSSATTGRTELWFKYIDYYINQSPIKILFGGNTVQIDGISLGTTELVSHNTYIDFFIRFGLFGGVFLTGLVVYKVAHAFWVYFKTKTDSEYCFLKLLVAGFSFTVSYFSGPLFVMIVIVLFLFEDNLKSKTNKLI